MNITQFSDVNEILDILLVKIRSVLRDKLLGLYLNGSLVIGDFEPGISDIDLVAALSSEISDQEFEELSKMHDNFISNHKEWFDRIEVCYITVEALKKVKSKNSMIVIISPGEPINRKEAIKEWLMNWYLLREKSKTLYGPAPTTIVEPISKEEFIKSVKDHARSWDKWVEDMRNPYAQSYAILALCRAFYVVRNGDQVSKTKAALWAKEELLEWSDTIQNAIDWRHGGKYTPTYNKTFPKTVEFINYVRGLIFNDK
ncbi:MAG TPA: aminoglycoside adenylyltransferase domain-containing protein [Candidatus Saccharimonadales bacterium]|nr:aminoglycoside adenylyltransferase domain-containing protein [Candidatus Saccharimonadales bacterium]